MSKDKTRAISCRLTGVNYTYWASVMKNSLAAKSGVIFLVLLLDHQILIKRDMNLHVKHGIVIMLKF